MFEISSALQSASTIFQALKDVKDINSVWEKTVTKSQVQDAYSTLQDIRDEVFKLREENRNLKDKLDWKEKLEWDHICWIHKETGLHYSPKCVSESKHNPVSDYDMYGGKKYACQVCGWWNYDKKTEEGHQEAERREMQNFNDSRDNNWF